MVENADDVAEGALAELLNNLIPVGKVLMHHDVVLLGVVVEAKVDQLRVVCPHQHHGGVGAPTCLGASLLAILLLALHHVKEVDGLILEDFCLLVVPEEGPQNLESVLRCHGELLHN